ncbi:MAG: universal stress protein [Bacteroidia bacterium]
MKTIIAATDFSPSSVNACRYAAFLAEKLQCKLTLFNLFEAPIIHSNVGLYGITYSSQKTSSHQKTKKLMEQLQKQFPKIKIDYFTTFGGMKAEVENFTKAHQVEAAVMGLAAKDKISKFLYGSTGVNIAGKIECPVIIVPSNYKTHRLSKVLLTVDNSEKLQRSSLSDFRKFILHAKSRVKILHVRTEDEFPSSAMNTIKITDKNQSIETINAKDIQSGVRKFCALESIDLVSIISKKHSAFYNLFFESNTKKVAFAAKVPVMAIHS